MTREQNLEDAFNSMLRTDYIPLSDTDKLNKLADYYVDYMGYMKDIVGPTDQLIVGRRGTGKTTLLYRSLVECMRSWGSTPTFARKKTLGIYLDLEKCQSLANASPGDFSAFEHSFVSELCDAIRAELYRSWPGLCEDPKLIDRLFKNAESKRATAVKSELDKLSSVLMSGIPRFIEKGGDFERVQTTSHATSDSSNVSLDASQNGAAAKIGAGVQENHSASSEVRHTERVHYRLSISDLLRVINDLREAAGIPYFLVFIDEFSSLSSELQGRFTTLLKKILGNHAGVYVKLCAITDNYNLGSSIILQRDLFELSLDLDSFVERSGSLRSAMAQLQELTKNIVNQRISSYIDESADKIFDSPDDAYRDLTRSAMGVPRTMGIVLKQAWSRASSGSSTKKIRKSDLDYGIRYASKAYSTQMANAARGNLALPAHVPEIFDALITRASQERRKIPDSPASHFMITPRNEERVRYLNMFFLVHLLEQGRTTKKSSENRSLYSFDYGITEENNLGWGDDKNVIRQQRFAYDDELAEYDRYYSPTHTASYRCIECGAIYAESDLMLGGRVLRFCPDDRGDLEALESTRGESDFTEEEIKIIGAIRSAKRTDSLIARQVADDVGCYVQKVAKFGEKLDRDGVIGRGKTEDDSRRIYFDAE